MKIKGWHFSAERLRDGTFLPVQGVVLQCNRAIVEPCRYGYHASTRAIDALMYAPGPHVARVELSDLVIPHGDPVDKYVSSRRKTITPYVDATEALRRFARECAQDVLHMWNPSEIVVKYLETGDEALREATWNAAWGTAWNATWVTAASYAAAAARNAARDAAWDAAWHAAKDAARAAVKAAVKAATAETAARDAAKTPAWAASWIAAKAAQNERLERLLNELLNILEQEDYL